MRRTIQLLVALLLAVPVWGRTESGRFKGIYIGEPLSALPMKCDIVCSGRYQSVYLEVFSDNDSKKVDSFIVVYSCDMKGSSREFEVTSSSLPTLAQAVKIHSLQADFSPPQFGYAKNMNGHVYGLVDVANQIAYTVLSPSAMGPESPVSEVNYLGNDAHDVLQNAQESPFSNQDSKELWANYQIVSESS